MNDKIPVTQQGFQKLSEALKHLKKIERPAIIQAIATAREHGDLSENAEYSTARERQSFIEGRINELENIVSSADVIDPATIFSDKITFGATVTLLNLDDNTTHKFQIVGDVESDITEGLVSVQSPMARALLHKKVNDIIEVHTPRGVKNYELIKLAYT